MQAVICVSINGHKDKTYWLHPFIDTSFNISCSRRSLAAGATQFWLRSKSVCRHRLPLLHIRIERVHAIGAEHCKTKRPRRYLAFLRHSLRSPHQNIGFISCASNANDVCEHCTCCGRGRFINNKRTVRCAYVNGHRAKLSNPMMFVINSSVHEG